MEISPKKAQIFVMKNSDEKNDHATSTDKDENDLEDRAQRIMRS